MKKLFLTLLVAALGLASSNAGILPSDGKVDAFTKTNPAPNGLPTVIDWSLVDLGNGSLLVTFTVTGHGLWSCYEVCTGNQVKYLGDGIAAPNGRFYAYVVSASDYVGCFISTTNFHGWAGPELQ